MKIKRVNYERNDDWGYGFSNTVVMEVNPKLMGRMCEFELGFRPFPKCLAQGEHFVGNVDYMGDFDLYRWVERLRCLREDGEIYNPSDRRVREYIEMNARPSMNVISPREVVGRIKNDYEEYKKSGDQNVAYCRENYISSGCLPVIPKVDENNKFYITPELVKEQVGEFRGRYVEAPLKPGYEKKKMTLREAIERGYNDSALELNFMLYIMTVLRAVDMLGK